METRNSILAIPPGETIKEQLEDRGMSQLEFADRMGYSTKFISQLLNGKVALTHPTALRLESVLGIPARFWNNLEVLYQEDLARIDQHRELEAEVALASSFPYADMVKKGWIAAKRSPIEKVDELRRFFEVASLKQVNHVRKLAPVFRKADHGKASEFALSAWLQKGYLEARRIQTKPFNRSRLKSIIHEMRSFANKAPGDFLPKLTALLAECGVALVLLPHLQDTYAHGATTWDSKTKAIIALTLRGKDADKFWFSLFHEVGHLCLHPYDNTFIQLDESVADAREAEADEFASDVLIPRDAYQQFVQRNIYTQSSIQELASFCSIPAGIVVGRLQHERKIAFNQLNDLKVKYLWDSVMP